MAIAHHPWWKEANIYQIYPASFQDSNGDGVGDLKGILSRIDYIKETGADAIWICPMYDSPQHDMGYDISDYEQVYPPYGTIEDMEAIIAACHKRGMKIILDLVINHTSNEHAWFKESRCSKDNDKRDCAWQWDDLTQEYYLHLFVREQPDLNWENPECREAIYESAIRFWLRKGIDGFRVDVVNLYSKPPGLPDAPVTDPASKYHISLEQVFNGHRIHEFLREMNEVMSEFGAIMTLGELPAVYERDHLLRYVSASAQQLNMVFQFDVISVGYGMEVSDRYEIQKATSWTLPDLTAAVAVTQELVKDSDGWVTTFLENHDHARSVSRWGSDVDEESRVRSAKMLATLQATLSGTLFVYQGQELGMVNAPREWSIDEYKDVASIRYYQSAVDRAGIDTNSLCRAMAGLQHLARDHARLPISWDTSANAGFTTGKKPWMRVHDNYKSVNAQSQMSEKSSVWSFWKQILQMRKKYADSLIHGVYQPVQDKDTSVFVYEKLGLRTRAVVALNFSNSDQPLNFPELVCNPPEDLTIGTYGDVVEGILRPFEGCVWIG